MATFTLTDAAVIVNSVTLSDHAFNVKVTDNRPEKDATTFGAGAMILRKGLGTAQIDIDFFQDFAAGSVYATLQPLIASTTPIQVEVRALSTARATGNPGMVIAQALLFNFEPLNGKVGEMSAFTATFKNAGSAGMSYPTA